MVQGTVLTSIVWTKVCIDLTRLLCDSVVDWHFEKSPSIMATYRSLKSFLGFNLVVSGYPGNVVQYVTSLVAKSLLPLKLYHDS